MAYEITLLPAEVLINQKKVERATRSMTNVSHVLQKYFPYTRPTDIRKAIVIQRFHVRALVDHVVHVLHVLS